LRFKRLSIAVAAALLAWQLPHMMAAEKETFQAKPAEQYANQQTSDGVTAAAETYTTDEQTKTAFGKLNPWRYNILPVLVVIHNNSKDSIRLDRLHFEYELPDRSKVDAMPAADVKYSKGPRQPKIGPGLPGGIRIGGNKNPLNVPEIETRAFAAKILPPGESASGFIYFETDVESQGASLYLTGLQNAATGKELYYFEIPLTSK
jgi:hypothetical protein